MQQISDLKTMLDDRSIPLENIIRELKELLEGMSLSNGPELNVLRILKENEFGRAFELSGAKDNFESRLVSWLNEGEFNDTDNSNKIYENTIISILDRVEDANYLRYPNVERYIKNDFIFNKDNRDTKVKKIVLGLGDKLQHQSIKAVIDNYTKDLEQPEQQEQSESGLEVIKDDVNESEKVLKTIYNLFFKGNLSEHIVDNILTDASFYEREYDISRHDIHIVTKKALLDRTKKEGLLDTSTSYELNVHYKQILDQVGQEEDAVALAIAQHGDDKNLEKHDPDIILLLPDLTYARKIFNNIYKLVKTDIGNDNFFNHCLYSSENRYHEMLWAFITSSNAESIIDKSLRCELADTYNNVKPSTNGKSTAIIKLIFDCDNFIPDEKDVSIISLLDDRKVTMGDKENKLSDPEFVGKIFNKLAGQPNGAQSIFNIMVASRTQYNNAFSTAQATPYLEEAFKDEKFKKEFLTLARKLYTAEYKLSEEHYTKVQQEHTNVFFDSWHLDSDDYKNMDSKNLESFVGNNILDKNNYTKEEWQDVKSDMGHFLLKNNWESGRNTFGNVGANSETYKYVKENYNIESENFPREKLENIDNTGTTHLGRFYTNVGRGDVKPILVEDGYTGKDITDVETCLYSETFVRNVLSFINSDRGMHIALLKNYTGKDKTFVSFLTSLFACAEKYGIEIDEKKITMIANGAILMDIVGLSFNDKPYEKYKDKFSDAALNYNPEEDSYSDYLAKVQLYKDIVKHSELNDLPTPKSNVLQKGTKKKLFFNNYKELVETDNVISTEEAVANVSVKVEDEDATKYTPEEESEIRKQEADKKISELFGNLGNFRTVFNAQMQNSVNLHDVLGAFDTDAYNEAVDKARGIPEFWRFMISNAHYDIHKLVKALVKFEEYFKANGYPKGIYDVLETVKDEATNASEVLAEFPEAYHPYVKMFLEYKKDGYISNYKDEIKKIVEAVGDKTEDVTLKPKEYNVDVDGKTFRFEVLKKNDPLGLVLGEQAMTGCCQKFGGVGQDAMMVAYTQPHHAFVVCYAPHDTDLPSSQAMTSYLDSDNLSSYHTKGTDEDDMGYDEFNEELAMVAHEEASEKYSQPTIDRDSLEISDIYENDGQHEVKVSISIHAVIDESNLETIITFRFDVTNILKEISENLAGQKLLFDEKMDENLEFITPADLKKIDTVIKYGILLDGTEGDIGVEYNSDQQYLRFDGDKEKDLIDMAYKYIVKGDKDNRFDVEPSDALTEYIDDMIQVDADTLYNERYEDQREGKLKTIDFEGKHILFDSIEMNGKYQAEENKGGSGVNNYLRLFVDSDIENIKKPKTIKDELVEAWKKFAEIFKKEYKVDSVRVSGGADYLKFPTDGLDVSTEIVYPEEHEGYSSYSDADDETFKMAKKLSNKIQAEEEIAETLNFFLSDKKKKKKKKLSDKA